MLPAKSPCSTAPWSAVFKNSNCMRALKDNTSALVAAVLLVCSGLTGPNLHAQSFSSGKNLHTLRASIPSAEGQDYFSPVRIPFRLPPVSAQTHPDQEGNPLSAVFLPRWSADCLPFFCKIEHNLVKSSHIPVKFRLGSVEYVDWLEGKTRFPTFAPR